MKTMKLRITVVGIVCLVFIQQISVLMAFDQPTTTQKAEASSPYQSFVDDLINASRADDPSEVPQLFDTQAMTNEVWDEDMPLPPLVKIAMNARMQLFLSHQFLKELGKIQKIKLLSAEAEPNGMRAAIVVRMVDEDEAVIRCRFWLTKSNERWLAYDFQDFALGVRTTTAIRGMVIETSQNPALRNSGPAGIVVMRAFEAVKQDDFAQVQTILKRIEGRPLPTFMEAMRQLLVGMVAASESRWDDAIEAYQQAATLQPDLVIVDYTLAQAYYEIDNYELCAEAAERYLKAVLEDEETVGMLVYSYIELELQPKARLALRRQLDHDPNSTVCFGQLCELSEDEHIDELVAHMTRMENPESVFMELFFEDVFDDSKLASAKRLLAVFTKVEPQSPSLDWFNGEVLRADKKYEAAAERFEKAARSSDGEEFERHVAGYFDCYRELGKPMAAYDHFYDKEAIIPHVCNHLMLRDSGAVDGLLARHAKDFPEDLNVPYFRGRILFSRDRNFAAADAEFAKVVPNGRTDELRLDYADERTQSCMGLRVLCHLNLGTWREALQKLPYPTSVAEKLAELFKEQFRNNDLNALLDAYEQAKVPNSENWIRNQRVCALLLNDQYASVVKRVDDLEPVFQGLGDLAKADWENLRSLRFKALLRQKDLSRATELADNESEMIQVAAARRDVPAVKELLEDTYGEVPPYNDLRWEDPDDEVLFRRDDFAALFESEGEAESTSTIVLLFDKEARLATPLLERAAQVVKSQLGGLQKADAKVVKKSPFAFDVRIEGDDAEDEVYLRALHHDSNFFGEPSRLTSLTDEKLCVVVQKSEAWIAIEPIIGSTAEPDQVSLAMAKMVVDFAKETKPVAIYLTKTRRVAMFTPELKVEILRSGLEAALKNAAHVPLGDFNQK